MSTSGTNRVENGDILIPIEELRNNNGDLSLLQFLKKIDNQNPLPENLKNKQIQPISYQAPTFSEENSGLITKICNGFMGLFSGAKNVVKAVKTINKFARPDIPPLLQKIFKTHNVEYLHQKAICVIIEKFNLKKVLFENPENTDTAIKVFGYIFNTISEIQNPDKSFIKPEINEFCKELNIQDEQLKTGINALLGLMPSFLSQTITNNPHVIEKVLPMAKTLIQNNDGKSYEIIFPVIKDTLENYGINNPEIAKKITSLLVTIAPKNVTFKGLNLQDLINLQSPKNIFLKTTSINSEKTNNISETKKEKKLNEIENKQRLNNRKKDIKNELKKTFYPSISNYLFSRLIGLLIKNSDKNKITHALSSTSFKSFSKQLSLNFFQKVIIFFPYILKGPFYFFTSAFLSIFGKSIINKIYDTMYNRNMDTRIENQKNLINETIKALNNFFIEENIKNQKIIDKNENSINQEGRRITNEKTIHEKFAKYFTENFINEAFISTNIKNFINKNLKEFFKIEDSSSTFLKVCFEIVTLPLKILSTLFFGMESIPKIVIRKTIAKILKKIVDHIQILTTNQEFISGKLLKLLKPDENTEKSTQTKPLCHGIYPNENEKEINQNLHSLIENLCKHIIPKLSPGEVFEKGSLANSLQNLLKTFMSKIKGTNEKDSNPLEKYLLNDLITNNFKHGFLPLLVDIINNLLAPGNFDNNCITLITSVSKNLGKTSTYNSPPQAKINKNKKDLENLILEKLQSYIEKSFEKTLESNLKKHLGIKEFPENIKNTPNDEKRYDILEEASKMTTRRFNDAILKIVELLYDPHFYVEATNNFLNNISA